MKIKLNHFDIVTLMEINIGILSIFKNMLDKKVILNYPL